MRAMPIEDKLPRTNAALSTGAPVKITESKSAAFHFLLTVSPLIGLYLLPLLASRH